MLRVYFAEAARRVTARQSTVQTRFCRRLRSTAEGARPTTKRRWLRLTLISVGALGASVPIGFYLLERRYQAYLERLENEPPPPGGKKKLVILGSGWGALSVIRHLEPGAYDVHVVSPRNYFLFTPLLPSVTVGTVEARSIAAPIRKFITRLHGRLARFYEAECLSVDGKRKVNDCPTARVFHTIQLTDFVMIPTGTHTRVRVRTHAHTRTCTHTHTHARTHARTHTRTHTKKKKNTCTCICTHTPARTRTYART